MFCQKTFFVLGLLLVTLFCQGQSALIKTDNGKNVTLPSFRKLYNVSYSQDDPENIMDVYLPAVYDSSKVIIYLHGSGWTGGDKDEFPGMMIDELVGKRKYILVSANYRLIKEGRNRFPSQMEDIRKLLSYLAQNAEKYHYSNKEFALMGGSAGAYLAMLYAYGYDSLKQVKAVVDFWGPTDLADRSVLDENKEAEAKVVNLLGTDNPAAKIRFTASPFYRVTPETGVPTLLFHGGKDPLVHVSQADKMYRKLKELNIPSQYEYYPDEQHGMKGAAGVDVFVKTLGWLAKYFPSK